MTIFMVLPGAGTPVSPKITSISRLYKDRIRSLINLDVIGNWAIHEQ